ncbi:MAG: hypothetical protein V3S40_07715 [Kiloniellales bacterium]
MTLTRKRIARTGAVLALALIVSACHYRAPGTYYYGGYYGQGYGHQGHSRSHHGYSW